MLFVLPRFAAGGPVRTEPTRPLLAAPPGGCAASDFFHRDEMRDSGDHPADLGTVGQGVGLADAAETEGAQRPPRLGLGADATPDLGDLELAHEAASSTSAAPWPPRCDSLYALSRPFGTNSSASRPRSFATSSGRFRLRRPSMVARATLMWLAEPSD